MKKNDNTTTTEKPAKKLTAEQKAKAKEKLAKKRAALKEKKRLAREKKAARLEKKRADKKAALEAKKAKKAARLEKKRARILKAKELKRARLEKKRAKLAAQKAKAKELKAKQKAKAKELKAKQNAKEKTAKVAIEKADLKNITTKDMTKELTKRLKFFVKILADNKSDVAEREEFAKRIEKEGIKVSVDNGTMTAELLITAATHVAEPKQPDVKCAAITVEQPKENAQPEAAAKEQPIEAESTEVPIGDTYSNEPTDEELKQIETEQDEEAADGAETEDDEEEIDPRSDVDDDQADFRREFFGAPENTEDFE